MRLLKCACVCLSASAFALVYILCRCVTVSCMRMFREGSSPPPRDTHQWPNTLSDCLPSLNELSRSCEKGSSFLASISNKMNRYARFAIHSIFSLSFAIKALYFTFK